MLKACGLAALEKVSSDLPSDDGTNKRQSGRGACASNQFASQLPGEVIIVNSHRPTANDFRTWQMDLQFLTPFLKLEGVFVHSSVLF